MNKDLEQLSIALEHHYSQGVPSGKERKDSREPSIAKIIQDKLGIPRTTYYRRLAKLERDGWVVPWERKEQAVFTVPVLASEDMDTQELIEHVTRRFEQRQRAALAKKWIALQFNIDGPVGICFLGDPHVDDNGCNWVKLRADLDTINKTKPTGAC